MSRSIEAAAFTIGGRPIGGDRAFVIAEAGVNHNGDLDLARQLVDIAADAQADAVKFQTYKTEALATPDAPKARYQVQNGVPGESQFDMLRRLELTAPMHETLISRCRERGVLFLSTPFDEQSADLLDRLGVPAFKVPSGELTNLPYLRHLAAKGRPMIVSTGMATLREVEVAVGTIREAGSPPLALLHCVSAYPARAEDVNLRAMATMRATFGVPVGYSDHTAGIDVPIAAAALGAAIIEKHFTVDRSLPGPDHLASLEPADLSAMIRAIRNVGLALGTGLKAPTVAEAEIAAVVRKSVVAACDIPAHTTVTPAMLAARRPGTGIPAAERDRVIGRTTCRAIAAGTLMDWSMLA